MILIGITHDFYSWYYLDKNRSKCYDNWENKRIIIRLNLRIK